MKILSFLIFIPLQILMIPFAITGVLWTAYKQVLVSKKLGTSQTAIEVLNGRWTMHVFGMRQDIAAAKLANRLPNTSTLGLWLVLFPLWLKYKISGSYFCLSDPTCVGKREHCRIGQRKNNLPRPYDQTRDQKHRTICRHGRRL